MIKQRTIDPRSAVPCRTVAFSPDCEYLVEANYLGFITVRSTNNGQIINRFMGQTALVENIRFEPGVNQLFLVGAGYEGYRDFGVVKIFEIPSGELIGELIGHSDDVTDIAFLEGGTRRAVSVGLDKKVIVYDLNSLDTIWVWEGYTDYLNMVVARPKHDGHFAVAGDAQNTVVLDVNKKEVVFEANTPGDSNGLIWSIDGRYLIVGDDHSELQYFDSADNWTKVSSINLGGAVKKTVRDPFYHERGIAACYDGKLWSFPLTPQNEDSSFIVCDRRKGLWGINVDATKDHIAAPSFFDRAYLMKRQEDGKAGVDFGEKPNATFGCNWISLSGNFMAISHDDGFIRFRSKKDGQFLKTIAGETASLFMGICFHPILPHIAAIDFYGEVWVYNYENNKIVDRCQMHFGPGITLDYSTNGDYLAVGGYRWDAWVFEVNELGKLGVSIALDKPNKSVVKNLNFLNNNDILVAAADGSIVYHSYKEGRWSVRHCIRTSPSMELCNGVTYCPKNNIIYAVSRDQTLRSFSAESGEPVRIGYGHNRSIKSVAVSECGEFVVTSGYDRIIIVWDSNSLKPILPPLRNANGGISCVKIESGIIYSCSFDGFVCAWDLPSGRIIWQKDSLDTLNKF